MTEKIIFDGWELARDRAKNFVNTFNLSDEIERNLTLSFEAHGRLAARDERKAIVRQFREWDCPHDGIDLEHMLGLIETEEHLK